MRIQVFRLLTAVNAVVLLVNGSAFSATIRPVDGPVILARSGATATYVWNATPFVARLVADRNLGENGIHALEATALTALAERARLSKAKELRMKVVYARTGAVSPVYGSPTFAGIESVLVLSVAREKMLKRAGLWAAQAANGKLSSAIHLEVTGKLPPAH